MYAKKKKISNKLKKKLRIKKTKMCPPPSTPGEKKWCKGDDQIFTSPLSRMDVCNGQEGRAAHNTFRYVLKCRPSAHFPGPASTKNDSSPPLTNIAARAHVAPAESTLQHCCRAPITQPRVPTCQLMHQESAADDSHGISLPPIKVSPW